MSSQQAAPVAPKVTPEKIMQYGWAYAPPLIIEAAIHNHVFDTLDEGGPMTAAELSVKTGASVRGLASIMNALTGLEFLTRSDDGRYELTAESAAFLVSTKPAFLGGLYRHMSKQLIPAWLGLDDIVRTGRPATHVEDEGEGSEFFERFVADIFPLSYGPARVAAEALNVGAAAETYRVLDVGAGSGVWGIALAQASPQVRVVAADWAKVLEVTRQMAARFGVGERFSYLPGNLRTVDFGTGYQVVTIGHILHSEGKEHSRNLLERVFAALAPGGTVVIAEFLVNQDRRGPVTGLLFGVNMLVNTEDGDTWSFEEIAEWLRECGYVNARTVDCQSHSPLILADKPNT
jgi:2-polyprenyl-3-methyl-5-hydroxy-6-metoxy-1,4-benzoquinol methylase